MQRVGQHWYDRRGTWLGIIDPGTIAGDVNTHNLGSRRMEA